MQIPLRETSRKPPLPANYNKLDKDCSQHTRRHAYNSALYGCTGVAVWLRVDHWAYTEGLSSWLPSGQSSPDSQHQKGPQSNK